MMSPPDPDSDLASPPAWVMPWLTASILVLLILVLLDLRQRDALWRSSPDRPACVGETRPSQWLSRQQLTQFLNLGDRTSRDQIQTVLADPYCHLPPTASAAGRWLERDAYPLAFDPQTWLVIVYDGDRYVGYEFSVR